uniref:Uncharacterized protein n=1 Tax=Leersia perrieri TaxID=77586 RepID=A0A0D9UWN6_9ORYZ
MDFDEYLHLQSDMFTQLYRCLPISLLKKESVDDDGNSVIMPASALDRLGYLHIEYPMQFQIQNANTKKTLHCGVLEFTAEEGFIHIPTMMMQQLGLKDNDLVLLQSKALPKATFVKLQPHTSDFVNLPEPRYLLEYSFRKYVCLTTGETIAMKSPEGEKTYYLNVLETQPADAICTLETDCNVNFETALNNTKLMAFTAMEVEHGDEPKPTNDAPVRFAGVGVRMDGKPVEGEKRPAPAVVAKPKRGIHFGSSVAAGVVKEKADEKDSDKRFTGKEYSLQD